jgi:trigger factor
MQVAVETTQGLERRLTITIPEKDISQELGKRLDKLAKTTKIAGFRPGKIPPALIQKRFGAYVRQEVVDELVNSNLDEALRQHQFRLMSTPEIEAISNEEAPENVSFTATFEIYPEVNLASFDGIEITRPEVLIDESDIDAVVENLRRLRQIWVSVGNRPARLGDRVKVDFKGTLTDGNDFSGNTGQDALIILGDGAFVVGFERHLVGAVEGETRTVDVTFPVGHQNQEIAGKSATFSVSVKSVESVQLPAVDEAFIRGFGVQEGTMEAFRQKVHKTMAQDFAASAWKMVKTQVVNVLYQHNNLELPKILVEEEITRLRTQFPSDDPSKSAMLEEQARRNVNLRILIKDIIDRQQLKADPERIRTYIRTLAEGYETPEEVENVYSSDKNRMQEMEELVLEDMAVEWVLEQAKVNIKPTPYSSLMVNQAR